MTAQPAPRRPRTRAEAWAAIDADPALRASLDRLGDALVACAIDVWRQQQAAGAGADTPRDTAALARQRGGQ